MPYDQQQYNLSKVNSVLFHLQIYGNSPILGIASVYADFIKTNERLSFMWIADQWKEYEVIDTSGGEKLERWGKYILVRPDPQVIWDTPKVSRGWKI